MIKKIYLPFCFVILFLAFNANALEVPSLDSRVNDKASLLQADTVDHLEEKLKLFEEKTSNQIAVLIIPNLEGEVLESYSLKVAETWKLGSIDKDNGVLLLIVRDDRKLRIEVGYGLEGFLTDATASLIINNEIVPYFKNQNYDEGITKGVDAIIGVLENTYVVDESASNDSSLPWFAKIFMFLIWSLVVGIHAIFAIATKNKIAFVVMYLLLSPFWLIFPLLIFGKYFGGFIFLTYFIGFPILKIFFNTSPTGLKIQNRISEPKSSSNNFWYSGFGNHSSQGGSSSSSSSSSSSYSGGGGRFGGGGSSGSW